MRIFFFVIILISSLSLLAQPKPPVKNDKDGTSGATPTYAISGNAKLTTNFIERGLSMSDNDVALNALFLVNLGSQFKFGFWGSNVSDLNSTDDNLWIKYIAEVYIEFQPSSKFHFYVHDDHFFKVDLRNGQRFGFEISYPKFSFLLERQTNFEGTGTTAHYYQFKYYQRLTDTYGGIGSFGYTQQRSAQYNDYFDNAATGYYKPFEKGQVELGVTLPSNTSQFGSRSKLNYFLAFALEY